MVSFASVHRTFSLTLLTADAAVAEVAQAAGVDRVGIDLEVKGKAQRQASRPSWISTHTLDDLRAVAGVVRGAGLFARIHPFELGGREELEQVLSLGAGVVMLPMFTSAGQGLEFVRAVDGRATPVLLLETVAAAADIQALLADSRDFEVHIGLNDLGIARGHASPFQVLTDPLVASIARQVRGSGRRLAVGRLARADDHALPVPADLVCALTASLGASGSFLSQYFFRDMDATDRRAVEAQVGALRARLSHWAQAPPLEIEAAMRSLAAAVARMSPRG